MSFLCVELVTKPVCVVADHGKDWMVCEGFQFILKQQAEALLAMGVRPELKVCF